VYEGSEDHYAPMRERGGRNDEETDSDRQMVIRGGSGGGDGEAMEVLETQGEKQSRYMPIYDKRCGETEQGRPGPVQGVSGSDRESSLSGGGRRDERSRRRMGRSLFRSSQTFANVSYLTNPLSKSKKETRFRYLRSGLFMNWKSNRELGGQTHCRLSRVGQQMPRSDKRLGKLSRVSRGMRRCGSAKGRRLKMLL
jgi:hypothetical protein